VPEGDTVWLTAKRLNDALAGEPVTTFSLRIPQLATADLSGDTVLEVLARGKHILMRFGTGVSLHSHLRMDGQWQLSATRAAAGRPVPRPTRRRPEHEIRALIGNDRWLASGYRVHDLRLVPTADESQLVGHLGPDLLGPDWDAEEAIRRMLQQPRRPIGEALLDQQNLAGIGNMYKVEVLFMHGVNPWTRTADVPALDQLLRTAHRLLRLNRDGAQQITTGSTQRGEQHWVYLRAGQGCRRCGGPIAVGKQGEPTRERDTYWCPACQPDSGTDSGCTL
jgi:endonuclease-8